MWATDTDVSSLAKFPRRKVYSRKWALGRRRNSFAISYTEDTVVGVRGFSHIISYLPSKKLKILFMNMPACVHVCVVG